VEGLRGHEGGRESAGPPVRPAALAGAGGWTGEAAGGGGGGGAGAAGTWLPARRSPENLIPRDATGERN